jgi:hypothetical protein
MTLLFWDKERHKYSLYVSQYVVDECALGDEEAARRRIEFIKGIPVIPKYDGIEALANEYHRLPGIPSRAIVDCFHLATSVIAKMDYLLSWNCTHLGIHTFVRIREYNDRHGYTTPLLLTPEALMEIDEMEV